MSFPHLQDSEIVVGLSVIVVVRQRETERVVCQRVVSYTLERKLGTVKYNLREKFHFKISRSMIF